MSDILNKYKPIPFWSWNDELDETELVKQIDWMYENGIGGFFMHARGGLTTPYLGEKWFSCIEACLKRAKELDMEGYAYDENGWPSGFAGGALLEDIENRDMYVTYKIGSFDKNAKVAFDISGDKLVKVTEGENVLNIYLNHSTSTADICNKEVVRKFIDLTHKKYKNHDKYLNLKGFFTDEPQVYRWGTAYTKVLPNFFLENYGEDIFERIGLLFVEKEGYKDFRYKYQKALQTLMIEAFAKQIYDWCDSNGYKLTGHYIEESSIHGQILCGAGSIMPFYEYEHIPGIDYLGRFIVRTPAALQLGSAAEQLDKRQTIGEIFGCTGWDCTPSELKRIAEHNMVHGVNLVCHHLLPYSEHGQRKRDYPEHFGPLNPWVSKGFKTFNDYLSKVGELLATSRNIAEVGVLCPVTSGYFYFKDELDWRNMFGCEHIYTGYNNLIEKLICHGVQSHILDETIMSRHARVEGNTLVVGKCRYKYIVVPNVMETMEKSTEKLLREFIANGGKIYLEGSVPTYLEGKPYCHDYLKGNVSFEDLVQAKPYKSSYSNDIRISYRISDDGKPFLYAVNIGKETDIDISFDNYSAFEHEGEVISSSLHFDEYESKILYPCNKPTANKVVNEEIKLNKQFKVIGKPQNYLTIDTLEISMDNGQTYSDKVHFMGAFNLLLNARQSGETLLRYTFNAKEKPNCCELLLEDTNTLEVKVNGRVVEKSGSILEKDLWKYDISHAVKEGENEIVVKINFFEDDNVYYVLFGENIQEALKNCLVYNTTIEAIYLRGDFGVYGDFKQDEQVDEVIIGNNFYLGKPSNEVIDLISDGYPFFRGNITLEQEIEVDDVHKTLAIDKRFQLIDLYVNDQFVKRLMLDYKADLSNCLKVGKNVIRLEQVISNRNLLGPFHSPEKEPGYVGPETFERPNTWDEKGKSRDYLEGYAFRKVI